MPAQPAAMPNNEGLKTAMRDIRELVTLPEHWQNRFGTWRGASFIWKRWDRPHENWTHDHCGFCFACICDHRERFPEWKQAHQERGCYRHAYYTEAAKGIYLWVCRTCFKRVHTDFDWSVVSTGERSQS